MELNKRFLEAYRHYQDEPRVQRLKTNVMKYNRAVRDLGLRDHQVSNIFFLSTILYLCYVSGSEGEACKLENTWLTGVSPWLTHNMVHTCLTRRCAQCTYFHFSFNYLEEEAERSVHWDAVMFYSFA